MIDIKSVVATLAIVVIAYASYSFGYWRAEQHYLPTIKEYEKRIEQQKIQAGIANDRINQMSNNLASLQEQLANRKDTIVTRYRDRVVKEVQQSCAVLPSTADAYNQFLQ